MSEYAHAKGRSRPAATQETPSSERRPLSAEEELVARENWKKIMATMPWVAEFLVGMAKDKSFDGRRALAEASVTIFPAGEKASDGSEPN